MKSNSTWFRLSIPSLIPNADKIVYLDGDMIINIENIENYKPEAILIETIKKAVIVGKYMYNFIEIYEYMKEAVFTCKDKEKLADLIQEAYENEELRNNLAEKAYNLLLQNNGASKKTLSIIDKYQGIV